MRRFWKQSVALTPLAATVTIVASIIGTTLCGAVRSASGAPPKGPSYSIFKLDDVNGAYSDGVAIGINNLAQIVGFVHDPASGGALRAASWTLTTTGGSLRSSLSILKGIPDVVDPSEACGVNDAGKIVGLGFEPGGEEGHALYWSGPDANPVVLPPLPGHNESIAVAINNDGVVCGHSNIRGGLHRAVAWRVTVTDGTPVIAGPVPLPDTDTTSRAYSINDNDASGVATIVGMDGATAVVWDVQSLGDGSLEVIPVPVILDPSAVANGINDADTSCGYLYGSVEAVVWTGSSRWILNRAKYVTSAYANDINNDGTIVGTSHYWRNFVQGDRAVVWPSATSSMILLDKFLDSSPFTTLLHARGVNDQGQIVGWGWMSSIGQYGAFVAVPK